MKTLFAVACVAVIALVYGLAQIGPAIPCRSCATRTPTAVVRSTPTVRATATLPPYPARVPLCALPCEAKP